MKLSLMEFQQDAVEELLRKLKFAKHEIASGGGDQQAVILSSPTGSGKTVITTAMIEEILEGSDRFDAEPGAVFLWMSDQPELNEQSRKKIASTSSRLCDHDLIVIESNFDSKTFEGGRVYFLNIQKLGKDKLLTNGKGDFRSYTIWETISNTAGKLKDKFYLIIDEAHRGTQISRSDAAKQTTIMQKFIKGSAGEIPPIDLILGVTATPQRFDQLLQQQKNCTPRRCEIQPDEVRSSGLLKDRIILFHPSENAPSDMTLLAEAARRWKSMRDEWNAYTAEQGKPPIYPAMVIQVEDTGGDNRITRTDLVAAIKTLEWEVGTINDDELAHSFQEDQTFTVGNHKIRKIEASRIQEETEIKFIFFKMALTTGWDCPRAEVMMSFRRAQDNTLIAQLIGRMIRAPLARRVEGRERLNTVSLYLPHYDRAGVDQVITRLKSDPDNVPPTDIDDGSKLVTFIPDKTKAEVFNELSGLQKYRVDKIRKTSNTRRLMRLSRALTMLHEIDRDAWDESKKLIIATLDAEKERLRSEDPEFDRKVTECNEITVKAVVIEQGTWKELTGDTITVRLDDHNINDLFNHTGQRLGEGLHLDYFQTHYNENDSNRAKLELFLVLENRQAFESLEMVCGDRINSLFNKHKTVIKKLHSSDQEEYNKVREIAKKPEALDFLAPAEIMATVDKTPNSGFKQYDKHLYFDETGEYWAKLNTWEEATIQAEIGKQEVVGWLRNYERKPWSLAIPYEYGNVTLPMFPDFIVVNKDEDKFSINILDPHHSGLTDSYAKARGLAKYAAEYEAHFDRIEIIRVDGTTIKRLNLNDAEIRKKVLSVDSNPALDLIFALVN